MSTDADATPRRHRARRGLWGHRDFLLLWSAQGVSAVGSRITRTALPMAAILVAGAGALDLGLLAAASTLPGVLVAWAAGGWVDRHRRLAAQRRFPVIGRDGFSQPRPDTRSRSAVFSTLPALFFGSSATKT